MAVFIVLEGIDGTGKTTAADAVERYLADRGHKVSRTAEPTGGRIGELVAGSDDLTPEAEALLFTADRAIHTKEICSLLSDGVSVISDRYYMSTLAYQSAAGMDAGWLMAINSKVIREPDVTILLDLDPGISLRRVDARGEKSRFEKIDYLRKVRERYLELAEEAGCPVVDASGTPEQVADSIIRIIEERI